MRNAQIDRRIDRQPYLAHACHSLQVNKTSVTANDDHPQASEAHEEAVNMLDFVANRSFSVGFVHWKIRFFAADHCYFDAAVRTRPKKVFKESRKTTTTASSAKSKKESDKSKRWEAA